MRKYEEMNEPDWAFSGILEEDCEEILEEKINQEFSLLGVTPDTWDRDVCWGEKGEIGSIMCDINKQGFETLTSNESGEDKNEITLTFYKDEEKMFVDFIDKYPCCVEQKFIVLEKWKKVAELIRKLLVRDRNELYYD